MSTPLRTVAVVLAGGTGSRVGLNIPKQLLKVAGKTILEHTLDVFQDAPEIDDIVLLMNGAHVDEARRLAAPYSKISTVEAGGSTRNETTHTALTALSALGDEDCWVLFHDAVRPLLDHRIITECVAALARYDAVDVAIPSADTIIVVDEHEEITDVPDRSRIRRGQTPQAFRLSTIRRAYELAWQDPDFTATDDCSVVLRYLPDVPIGVVHGSEQNMKVTHPIDIFLADKLFQLASSAPPPADPAAYQTALAGKSVVVLGGSYGIGADIAALAREHGATVETFSRSSTNTHVERRSDLVAVAEQVAEKHGRIDYVVATAGILPRGSLLETTEETIYAATEVNYLAPVFIAQVFFPHLHRTGGSLLLFTSSSYTRGRSGYSLYSSAKAAVVNLTQALADEWAESGVRVNVVNPERTGTPMRTKAFGEEPAGSLLDSQLVAKASIDVLLSEGTGHVLDLRKLDPLAETFDGA